MAVVLGDGWVGDALGTLVREQAGAADDEVREHPMEVRVAHDLRGMDVGIGGALRGALGHPEVAVDDGLKQGHGGSRGFGHGGA